MALPIIKDRQHLNELGERDRSKGGKKHSQGLQYGGDTGSFCQACFSWRGHLGLEPTPDLYVQHLVEIFREARRVLRDDGVVWLNLGDCYHSGDRGGYRLDSHRWEQSELQSKRADRGGSGIPIAPNRLEQEGLADGDVVGIPWRVVMALQADGWRWRQTLHWWKKSPMPESQTGWRWVQHRLKIARSERAEPRSAHSLSQVGVNQPQGARDGVSFKDHSDEYRDCPGCKKCEPNDGLVLSKGSWRHTSAVEYVFMLTKQMQYWSDGEIVKEPSESGASDIRKMVDGYQRFGGKNKDAEDELLKASKATNIGRRAGVGDPSGRNPRNFTLLATESYQGAHYATFGVNLILPLIQATCPKRCCPSCGQGWAPIVSKRNFSDQPKRKSCKSDGQMLSHGDGILTSSGQAWQDWRDANPDRILGYRPTCSCDVIESISGIVLDPFCGSGTTGEVCNMLGLRFIGIDLSMPYLRDQAAVRVEHRAINTKVHDLPLFAGFPKEVESLDAETTVGH